MKAKDLTGQKFGRLTVIGYEGRKRYKCGTVVTQWKCLCECGNQIIVNKTSLTTGHCKSCGCLHKDITKNVGLKNRKHGMAQDRLYYIWASMKARCNNPNAQAYHNYGKRGIKVCEEWNNSFDSFRRWAYKNGYNENLTIERNNVDGDYSPNNCCWITLAEQGKNRQNSIRIIGIDGEKVLASEIADKYDIPMYLVRLRLKQGWDIDKALRTPKIDNHDKGKVVEQYTLDGKLLLNSYKSLVEMTAKTSLSKTMIGNRCRNGGGIYKGFYWKYKEKIMIKIKYLKDIEHISKIDIGDMIDLRCAEDVMMKKGEYKVIPLGVAMQLPTDYYAEIFPRSSTFSKYKIIMVNGVGVIDGTYCGNNDEWKFPALAIEDTFIAKGSRICQFKIVKKQPEIEFEVVETLGNEDRGGFGSTGVK